LRADVDPVAYITSANVKRRQMTKGQIAIVAARALLDSNNQDAVAASSASVGDARQAASSLSSRRTWLTGCSPATCRSTLPTARPKTGAR
jgi:hypothetical protein